MSIFLITPVSKGWIIFVSPSGITLPLAETTTSQGIINHSVGNFPKGSEIDVSIIYADYYFLEAIQRYKNMLAHSTRLGNEGAH